MSFIRREEIFRPMWDSSWRSLGATTAAAPTHRLDEFPAGYSSAGWSPPVVYQTIRLDKEARNSVRLASDWGTTVVAPRPQQRPRAQWCPTSPTTSVVSGPRAQCSDDKIASTEARMISFGRLPFGTARADAGAD